MNRKGSKIGWAGKLGAALIVVVALCAGCAKTMVIPSQPEDWPEPAKSPVLLYPGDAIEIRFQYFPELEDEQLIRPDGSIALKLVGTVQAAGLTPEELQQKLKELYAPKTINPDITVVVTAFASREVYVSGQVREPGLLPMKGRFSALDAIMTAGGFVRWTAKRQNVIVLRVRDGKRHARVLNLRKALTRPESQPFYLEPYDVVYVPRTRIDHVDQWVDQYVDRLIPSDFQMYYSFVESVGSTKSVLQTVP